MNPDHDRMRRWRNVNCHDAPADAEITRINAMEDELGPFSDEAEHVRALVSRFNSLSHYRAADNLTFIMRAIGSSDYPGMPAVDVLWRHERIDGERRAQFRRYYRALQAWLAGEPREQAKQAAADGPEELDEVYAALGDSDDTKRWLAASLAKTLAEYVLVPEDVIAEHDDEAYIRALYEAVLHRHPSPDDLRFRVAEMAAGKTRDEMFDDILAANEHTGNVRGHIAAILKRSGDESR